MSEDSEGLRIGQVAQLVGVSADTVRRWCDQGDLAVRRTTGGERRVEAADLARFVAAQAPDDRGPREQRSARNNFPGIVTAVERDGVMAKVELQAGPHRIVSLMSREAADDLGLQPGSLTTAVVKATNVVVQSDHDR